VARILVVDDAPEMTWLLEKSLSKDHHDVEIAYNGQEGLRKAYAFQPDLVVLDIMMPDMDGWDMLRRLRQFSEVPVIMLTAITGVDSRIRGLDGGADDYLSKPFEVEELKARIRAMLRRATTPLLDRGPVLRFDGGQLIVDPVVHQVTVRGSVVSLTPTEYKLLLCLALNAGRALTYSEILDSVWGPGYEDGRNNVKVYIQHLRRKIEADPGQPRYILNQWGIGYCLAKI
jgi:two-component system KDP operon response regulator KdpE